MLGDKGEVPEEEYLIPFGKANVVREGTDCTLFSWGRPVNFAVEAAEELAKEGLSAKSLTDEPSVLSTSRRSCEA